VCVCSAGGAAVRGRTRQVGAAAGRRGRAGKPAGKQN